MLTIFVSVKDQPGPFYVSMLLVLLAVEALHWLLKDGVELMETSAGDSPGQEVCLTLLVTALMVRAMATCH